MSSFVNQKRTVSPASSLLGRLLWLPWAALALTVPIFLLLHVAPNDDEFMYYNALSCFLHPDSAAYSPLCRRYDLFWETKRLVLRSYYYVGATPALFYAPLHWIWPSIESLRLMNLLSLGVSAWAFTRSFRLGRWDVLPLFFCFFPLVFQVVVDTGPVSFQLCVFFLAASFFHGKTARGWTLLLGILLAIALIHKPIFLLLLPALFLCWLSRQEEMGNVPKLLREHGLSFLLAILPSCLLFLPMLFLRTPNGSSYFLELKNRPSISFLDPHKMLSHFTENFSCYFGNFQAFANRIYNVPCFSVLTFCSWILLLSLLLLGLIFDGQSRKRIGLCLLGVLVTILLINRSEESRAGHHAVLFFPAFLYALGHSLQVLRHEAPRLRMVFLLLFLLLQFQIASDLVYARSVFIDSDPVKDHIVSQLKNPRRAAQYSYVILDWGLYHQLSLYGAKNQILFGPEDPITTEFQAEEFNKVIQAPGRKLIFVLMHLSYSRFDLFQKRHPDLHPLNREFGLPPDSNWEVWGE